MSQLGVLRERRNTEDGIGLGLTPAVFEQSRVTMRSNGDERVDCSLNRGNSLIVEVLQVPAVLHFHVVHVCKPKRLESRIALR